MNHNESKVFVEEPWTNLRTELNVIFDENTCFYNLELVKYQRFYQVKFSLEFQFQ